MITPDWNQLVPLLGVATPLVIILLQLLSRAEKREERAAAERKETTEKHLQAQKEYTESYMAMLREFLIALSANTAAVKELTVTTGADHKEIVTALKERKAT